MGYKTRRSPGRFCRALLFPPFVGLKLGYLLCLHRRVSYPNSGTRARYKAAQLTACDSEKLAGKDREDVGGKDCEALHGVSKAARSEICRSLIELIKLRTELGIAVSVCESDYLTFAPPELKVDAYTFCLQYCMWGVVAWATKYNIKVPISYFFESGHKNEAVADSFINFIRGSQGIVNGLRYHSHTFVSGKRLCGIAAADLLAWEFSAAYRNKFGPVRRPVRLSFQNLMRLTHIVKHFRTDSLRKYFIETRAIWEGEQTGLAEEFTRFLSTRDFPEKPLDAI